MSCAAQVVTSGGPENLGELAEDRAKRLERLWSRFVPTSEISMLNGRQGIPVMVSPETFELVAHAVDAWQRTEGRFDPTVYDAIVAAGYETSYASLPQRTDVVTDMGTRAAAGTPAPGCADIVLEPALNAVTLPEGVRFDPGGIGKGLAADLLLDEMLEAGADAALINLGGDLCCGGDADAVGGTWTVDVEHLGNDGPDVASFELTEGAVATSSRLTRTWRRGGHTMHHIIDPVTGLPAESDVTSVTAIAAVGWWAEAVTKAVFDCDANEAAARLTHWAAEGIITTELHGIVTTFEPEHERQST